VVGTEYANHTIIGGEKILVTGQEGGHNSQWWRILDWSNGYPLSGPWEGLTIPDTIARFYWVEDWTDSSGVTRKHIRADFDNTNTDLLDRFWQQAHDSAERTEITLVDTDELSTVDDGVDVNVNILDFYFRYLWGDRGLVVDLDTEILGDSIHRAVLAFIRRETPVGSVRLIRTDGGVSEDYAENDSLNPPGV